jgi:6-phosphofructokinase 1
LFLSGDGTHRGANVLSEECIKRNLNIAVAGIPKTIDNDVDLIDRCALLQHFVIVVLVVEVGGILVFVVFLVEAIWIYQSFEVSLQYEICFWRSFGFTTSVEAAQAAILSAKTEARCNLPNGIGIVKLMGRSAGFIAVHATMASGPLLIHTYIHTYIQKYDISEA